MKLNKLVLLCGIVLGLIIALPGCQGTSDYTEYFSITSTAPMDSEDANVLEIEYEINNLGKKDDLVFCVSINDTTKEYSVAAGDKQSDTVEIDIGRPTSYALEYPVTYEVKKEQESVWTKEDVICYDCTDMFVHTATINYGSESAEVQTVDYQSNYFDLSELFSSFDADKFHKAELENKNHDIAHLQESEAPQDGAKSVAYGKILELCTYGTNEVNDTYHFTDGLVVNISEAMPASSVNWSDYMEFTNESRYSTSTVVGIDVTTFEMDVIIENPCDETIYGNVTKFYVNDSPISDEYLVAGGDAEFGIAPSDTGKVYNISSPSVWTSTGETHVTKFGLNVVLTDSSDNVLYDDIQWLYLD